MYQPIASYFLRKKNILPNFTKFQNWFSVGTDNFNDYDEPVSAYSTIAQTGILI